MTKNIRQGVFETNSSSTHSICISKDTKPELPESLDFRFGEYGWEVDTLSSIEEKASYLYTGLMSNERKEDIEKIKNLLSAKGVSCKFQEPDTKGGYFSSGYVDHGDELGEFLDEVVSNEDSLLSYLFSPLSFVLTGNDNDDCDVEVKVDYDHQVFFKGN